MSRSNIDCKVYVGDLELEDAFSYYGPLNSVWVARNPPGFAFVEFEDPRDARDAVRGLDGRTVCNRRISVEMSTGRSRNRGGGTIGGRFAGNTNRFSGGGYNPNDRCYECGERGHYAYDCPSKRRIGSGSRRSRSRSRSRDRDRRSRSRDRKSRTRSFTRSRSRDRARSRSRSPRANGDSRRD
ncbi:serine/arginine-rich splicing factor 7-like isoform X2 [Pollicipes pollicipes]|uniref:serine/arginine-rich splicing factor 7-like isoform X2 n=1 Tax=Pollicipes pollicipes TaxID=41117 RepID=UPI0018850CD0|nr:serine/arginine-rich splicing factor 7-like isoform X2 [Pollicipes pollicipes]XP_037087106.1 serine/arginine-rich splicing factor 7-like isoform X2 [Pollicipes pollicipes]